MRKKICLIVILLSSIGVFAQKSNYFKVDSAESVIFLRPTNGMVRPASVKSPYDIPISLKQEKEAIIDIRKLLKEKFPKVNDDDFNILKNVVYIVYFSGKGKVIYYNIMFPIQYMDSFTRFEKQLYEVAETLSDWDFSKYGLNIYSPDEVTNRIGGLNFPLLWLRSRSENRE